MSAAGEDHARGGAGAGRRGRLTRRQAIGGGLGLLGLLLAGGYGRFAIGDEFEAHVADVLGAPPEVTKALLDSTRERLGDGAYEARASAFLTATTFPGRLLPARLRERAVDPFIENLIAASAGNLVYLGVREPTPAFACAGLVTPQ